MSSSTPPRKESASTAKGTDASRVNSQPPIGRASSDAPISRVAIRREYARVIAARGTSDGTNETPAVITSVSPTPLVNRIA